MNRRRVIVSPSNAPGIPRSSVYLDLCLSRLSGTGRKEYRRAIQGDAIAPRRACAHRLDRLGGACEHELLGPSVDLARAPADGARAGAPHGLGELGCARALRERAERDHVGELGHRERVAQRDQPREPDRVQPIARQQPQIVLWHLHHARRAVVQQVALVDRLDQQLVLRSPAGRARPVRGELRWRRRLARAASGSARPSLGSTSVAISPPSRRRSVRRRSSAPLPLPLRCIAALTRPPAAEARRRPRRRPRRCARAARRCAPATGTTPRTATAAGRRRARAARGTRRRGRPGRTPARRRSDDTGRSLKKTVMQPRHADDLDGIPARAAAAGRPPRAGRRRGAR